MNFGLLAGLSDPAVIAKLEERKQLIQRVAEIGQCDYESTKLWLDAQDASAMDVALENVKAGMIACLGAYH